MARLENQLWMLRARCLEEEARVRKLIADVDNPQMRMILALHLIREKNWTQIAVELGGNNTKSGVKAQFYRWLKEQKVATKCNS